MNKRPTLTLKSPAKPASTKPSSVKPRSGAAPYAKPAGAKTSSGQSPYVKPAGAKAPTGQGPYAKPAGTKAASGQSPYAKSAGTKASSDSSPYAKTAGANAPLGQSPYAKSAVTKTSPERQAPRGRAGESRPAPQAAQSAPEAPQLRSSFARAVQPALQTGFKTHLKPDSLAFALSGAAAAVSLVRTGMALPQALNQVASSVDAIPQARGAMQDIAYRCMRQLGLSEALVGLMAPKAPDAMVASLLHCALALMTAPDEQPPYEEFTIVDQTVTAADAHPDTQRAKGMVNAVLRRFLRERQQLLDTALLQPEARWNYPQWWIDATKAAWPSQWQDVLTTGNTAPPLTLRVNVRKNSVEEYLSLLDQHGIAATRIGPYAVRLAKPVGVHLIPGFAEGRVSVQDAGAQLAAPLLDVQDGMRVLDACAAPGGKTGHILELAEAHVTALDADPKRLLRVGENLDRLQLKANLQPAEAQNGDWWDGQPFDRILADVPCTASGIVRRHPDIRWLRRKSDTLQLATLSAKILDNLWQMLRPNGKLLFVTCSLWPQESEAQAAAFAVRNGALRLDAPGQLLPAGGIEQDHDGLFYALFQKHA